MLKKILVRSKMDLLGKSSIIISRRWKVGIGATLLVAAIVLTVLYNTDKQDKQSGKEKNKNYLYGAIACFVGCLVFAVWAALLTYDLKNPSMLEYYAEQQQALNKQRANEGYGFGMTPASYLMSNR